MNFVKDLWSLLNTFLSNKKLQTTTLLVVDGKIMPNFVGKGNIFNTFETITFF